MLWLLFGVILWADVHAFGRVAPIVRQSIGDSLGVNATKGIISVLLIASIIMMVIGFQQMDATALYHPPAWLMPIAVILDVIAVALLMSGHSKSRIRGWLRHPMLTAVVIWGIAHLMIAGEWRAIILFGGMIIWAVFEIRLINAQEPEYIPYKEGTLQGDIRLAVITLVTTAVIVGIHIWILRG